MFLVLRDLLKNELKNTPPERFQPIVYVAPHHHWQQQEKKSTQYKDPLKSKKFQFHFFEHMCSFKNKHNRFAEKIIGAVNNFVNESEPLRGS